MTVDFNTGLTDSLSSMLDPEALTPVEEAPGGYLCFCGD